MGPTNPAAGVMATSPATAPEIAPRALARPFLIHSAALQASAAAAAPKCVATKALDAKEPAASALPALKPNHPKIGRASCRERVEISVVAVSLKKKNKKDEINR